MAELKTEEEQIEAFKVWWKKNGTKLVLIIAVCVSGYFGFQAWQTSQENYRNEASSLYQNLIQAAANLTEEENQQTVSFVAQQLKDDYEDTSYAMFAQLFVARIEAEKGEYDNAIQSLEGAISSTDDQSFIAIANLRVARLLLQKAEFSAAMERAEKVVEEEFFAQQQELIGDIYTAQGKRDDARTAYEKASEALAAGVNHPLLAIKLQDLVKG